MKLYFYLGYFRTGGPESFHQYCDMVRRMGYDGYIYYHDAPSPNSPCLYIERYIHLERALEMEDDARNVLFLPECESITKIREKWAHIRIVLCWLSFSYGKQLLGENAKHKDTMHAFQSYFARDMVTKIIPYPIVGVDLYDYTHDDIILQGWNPNEKKDIIAYNPSKDVITPRICKEMGVECLPIKDMKPLDVIRAFQKCKVYMDCGFHPGKDRMPREAAALGCVVITNQTGSAAYHEDLPIIQRCKTASCAVLFVKHAFEHYKDSIFSQDAYRTSIFGEKAVLAKQMRALLNMLEQ